MQQLIYYGATPTDRLTAIQQEHPNATLHTLTISSLESSLKVAEIRDLLTTLSITTSHPRLVHIQEANTLTIPAQNTLLKTLEEPPVNTTIILSLDNLNSLLPTIISRCQTIKVASTEQLLATDSVELKLLKDALQATPGVRLQLASTLGKDRLELTNYLRQLTLSLHQLITKQTTPNSLKLLAKLSRLVHTAHLQMSANTNPTLTIEHLFLSLPNTS